MVLTYTKQQAAASLIGRAIRVVLHDADHLSALVLAGSAEVMLGQLLGAPAKAVSERESIAEAQARFAGAPRTDRDAVDVMRRDQRLSFDWLRHSNTDETRGPLAFDAAQDAALAIERSLELFRRCFANYPACMAEWEAARRTKEEPTSSGADMPDKDQPSD